MHRKQINILFDYVLKMEEGEQKAVGFKDKNTAEAARVALYRQKNSYEFKTNNDSGITISKKYDEANSQYVLVITKRNSSFTIFDMKDGKITGIIKLGMETGSIIPKDLEEVSEEEDTEDLKDIIKTLRESGYTDEEVEEWIKEYYPDLIDKWRDIENGE